MSEFKTLSIRDLLTSDAYLIPLYQRNYAWTTVEITQLLDDIFDQYRHKSNRPYYIGTLVVDLKANGLYEIIDGQQRHTTLTLLAAVAKAYHPFIQLPLIPNLDFEGRENAARLIANYFADYTQTKRDMADDLTQVSITRAIRDIERYLSHLTSEKEAMAYLNYLFDQVLIVRTEVPPGTDINHYFEVMNNRGEQLEKHEVLKARLMNQLPVAWHQVYGQLWDACAQMDKYLRQGIAGDGLKNQLFDGHYRFQGFYPDRSYGLDADTQVTGHTLRSLLEDTSPILKPGNGQLSAGSFTPVINFPNFLLQVLRLSYPGTTLDDKRLLDTFGDGPSLPEPLGFLQDLLFYRDCFDRFVIRSEAEGDTAQRWKIQSYVKNGDQAQFSSSFPEDKDFRLAMLQSMLHVSFPGNMNKRWLQSILQFFKSRRQSIESGERIHDELTTLLDNYATEYFQEVKPLTYDQGTATANYIFNYLDYRLWEKYVQEVQGAEVAAGADQLRDRIVACRTHFNAFRFTQNNSVEHVSPQHPVGDEKPVTRVDQLGNLCLISRSNNSRLSNHGFKAKKEYFEKDKRFRGTESLKQCLIFSYEDWTDAEILAHGHEMITLLSGLPALIE